MTRRGGSGARRTHRDDDRTTWDVEFVEDAAGPRLVVSSFESARALLRLQQDTEQAGFNADLVRRAPVTHPPMLYTEGDRHREQRRLAARYFTPRAVTERHHAMIEAVCDELVTGLERRGGGRLETVSLRLAMRVVCQVVGLTHSPIHRLEPLLDGFFAPPPPADAPRHRRVARLAADQARTLRFYLRHVRPAIRAHRREPRDDVLTSLIDEGLPDRDLVVECITYAAAGMVTTRQFIAVATMHLLDDAELRERYLTGSDAERRSLLYELIRLEAVVSRILRRTTAEVTLPTPAGPRQVPAGTLVELDVRAANIDPVLGDNPLGIDPARCPVSTQGRVPPSGLAFGAGHHSCPGEYLALEETDIFLRRFFAGSWQRVGEPTVVWNDLLQGYDISGLVVRPADATG